MSQIPLISEFEPSNIVFADRVYINKERKTKSLGMTMNGNKVYIQLPPMRATFGLSAFTDEKTGVTSYSIPLNLDAETEEVKTKLAAIDSMVLNLVAENSLDWMGKKGKVEGYLEYNVYKPLVKRGKPGTDYENSFSIKPKVGVSSDGSYIPKAYTENREEVLVSDIEKGQKVTCIIEIGSIWFTNMGFGTTMRLHQVLLHPVAKLSGFAFRGVKPMEVDQGQEEASEEEEVEEEADDEEDEVDM